MLLKDQLHEVECIIICETSLAFCFISARNGRREWSAANEANLKEHNMYISGHNIIFNLSNEKKIILNLLWGTMDLLDSEAAQVLDDIYSGRSLDDGNEILAQMMDAGYVLENRMIESDKFALEYEKYNRHVSSMPENFFIIPTYGCNMSCVYCFQEDVPKKHEVAGEALIDRAFGAIGEIRSGRNSGAASQITIYGGEPLQMNADLISAIRHILGRCTEWGYRSVVVTNGTTLSKHVGMLKDYNVGEVHVTLDGTRDVHDARRMSANGKGTFDRIVRGIDSALSAGLQVHLRIVVDKRNINNIPQFSTYLADRGWLDDPGFRVHIGRTNECGVFNQDRNYVDRIELLRFFAEHAHALKGIEFGFSGIKKAVLDGELPPPLFSHCPSCIQEVVFDLYGNIYACPGACGQARYQVGRFNPSLEYFDIYDQWKSRSILKIEKCRSCNVALACGGGCPLKGLAEGKGVFEPDCPSIEEEMQLGVDFYSPQLFNAVSETGETKPRACPCPALDEETVSIPMAQEKISAAVNSDGKSACSCNIKIIPLDDEA